MTNYYIIYNYIEYKQSQLHFFSAVRKQFCFHWVQRQNLNNIPLWLSVTYKTVLPITQNKTVVSDFSSIIFNP